MDHMDVFFILNLHRIIDKKIPEEAYASFFDWALNARFDKQDILNLQKYKPQPTNTQWAHYLRNIGFSQQMIAQFLNVKQPSISYHLAKKVPTKFYNAALDQLIRHTQYFHKRNL